MRRFTRQIADRQARRTGSVSIEMLMILPVFLILLFAFVELTSIVLVEERLAAASSQGARVASQGGSTADVQTAVQNYLGSGATATNLNPIIFDPADPTTAFSGAPVTVRLEVPANMVVPNLLSWIGFSLGNQILVGQTVMRKE